MQEDIPAFEDFADGDQGPARITAQVVKQANELVVSVYANMGDNYVRRSQSRQATSAHISEQQVNSADAPIPPTESAYEQHIKRAALATAIGKSAYICNSNVEPREDYGWTVDNGYLMPVQSTRQAWPHEKMHTIPCGCTKGCSRNCSCAKKNIACY